MTIYEFADVIGHSLVITRYANQNNRFSASFEYCDIKQGSMLMGEYGNGKTPQEAINNYKNLIIGKTLVFNAMSKDYRQEYIAPIMQDI